MNYNIIAVPFIIKHKKKIIKYFPCCYSRLCMHILFTQTVYVCEFSISVLHESAELTIAFALQFFVIE